MSSLPFKILVAAFVGAFALATSANAENAEKVRKHKKVATTSKTVQPIPIIVEQSGAGRPVIFWRCLSR